MKYRGMIETAIFFFVFLGVICPVKAEDSCQVIVNVENPNDAVRLKMIKEMFFGRVKVWPKSQNKIILVDLPEDSPVRKQFSQALLGKPMEYMAAYWQKQIYGAKGKPPKTVSSEQEVIKYIAHEPNAVGYISGTAELSEPNVKLIVGKLSESSGDLSW